MGSGYGSQVTSIYSLMISLQIPFSSSHLHSFELAHTFLTVLRTLHSFFTHYQRSCIGRSPIFTPFTSLSSHFKTELLNQHHLQCILKPFSSPFSRLLLRLGKCFFSKSLHNSNKSLPCLQFRPRTRKRGHRGHRGTV